jgi:DNA-binding CsgD family transcriptional regulator
MIGLLCFALAVLTSPFKEAGEEAFVHAGAFRHGGVRAGGIVGEQHGMTVAPFRPERIGLDTGSCAKPLALLVVTDPAEERIARKEHLRRRFGLTRAEADVAMEIAYGDGRKAAAARLGVADSTARMHLTRIFEKTGVRRQAELVRVVLQPGDEQARK